MNRKIVYGILLGAGAAALALVLELSGALSPIESISWSWRVQALSRPSSVTPKIKIIVIDEASLRWAEEEQRITWPWPREVYAAFLSFLRRGGAKVVSFDMLYPGASPHGRAVDELFGEALKEGPPNVMALMLTRNKQNVDQWTPLLERKILPLEENSPPDSAIPVPSLPYALLPVDPIAKGAMSLGNVFVDVEDQGTISRVHLFYRFAGHAVPSLPLAAYMLSTGKPVQLNKGGLSVDGRHVPLDSSGRAILNFRGTFPSDRHEKISAHAVLESELRIAEGMEIDLPVHPSEFRDCYVFFGVTATALHDLKATPIDPLLPGVEVHTTVLDNLLAGDFMADPPLWVIVCSLFGLSILAGITGVYAPRAWQNAISFPVFLSLPVCIGVLAYIAGWWWPMTGQLLASVVALIGAVVVNYATEGRQRRFIRKAFGHYLSPDVIARLESNPDQLSLGGERRELTIFFSDLQGFTTISEKMEPQDLTHLLNDYLSDMTDIIHEEGGTLDKYEGDAIIAFWNAPLDLADHPLRGVRAALRCQRRLAERRAEFEDRAGAPIQMRIGMHTGVVVVGNMGSSTRFDYSMLGDAANLAARLEGANKAFGTYTMVSEVTMQSVRDHVLAREIGSIRVVGRKEPITVYEPYAMAGESDVPGHTTYSAALEHIRHGKMQKALSLFESIADDPLAATYAKRCRELLSSDSPRWDGIWNLTSK